MYHWAQYPRQRRLDGGSKGRHTYEFIPEVNTEILWPRKREVGVAYCRILLHDTMLTADAFRTGVAESSICACKQGCSLGLETVSRRSFQTSRSRLGLVETWEGLGLDLVSD